MSDKQIIDVLLSEGSLYAIKSSWVNPDDIEDEELKEYVEKAYFYLGRFETMCKKSDEIAEILNDDLCR